MGCVPFSPAGRFVRKRIVEAIPQDAPPNVLMAVYTGSADTTEPCDDIEKLLLNLLLSSAEPL
jgi:hypothetical protein